jgi:imidazolonepropionase-like amidohydrolase
MNPPTLLSAAACLSGRALEEVRPAEIVVESGIIREVRRRTNKNRPDLDLGSLTLIPGFIDAHVHIGFFPPTDVLAGGVTTARDLGWPPTEIYPLVARSQDPGWPGPRILAAGPMLTCPGGYPTRAAWAPEGTGRVVAGVEDARAAVAERAAEGAAIVKVALNPAAGPTLDEPVLTAICDAAHEHGLQVTGHIYGLDELHKALAAGVDELAHMLMSPEAIPDDTLSRMVENGVRCIPTLSIQEKSVKRFATDNLQRLIAAGGTCIYGTDLGNEGPRPGIDAPEIADMAAAGMDGRSIVGSATVTAATELGLTNVGVLEAGMQADIVGVNGDPLRDSRALADVRFVMRAGVVHRGPS